MQKHGQVREQIVGRMYVVLLLLALMPLLIVAQLAWIHLSKGKELRREGLLQARSQTVLPARRGIIADQAGRALVVNTPRFELALDPLFPGFEDRRSDYVTLLARITGWHPNTITQRIDSRSSPQYVRLGTVTATQHEALDALDVPGLILLEKSSRRYKYGATAAHVLGHVDRDGVGQAGLELRYDEYLQGTPGRRMLLRDRRGYRRVDAASVLVEPVDGQTLVLTIDLIRQTILEEELARGVQASGAERATAIAVDPRTGAILALANVPSFDPNSPQDVPRHAWRNSAITDRLEPGSSFKLVGASAAIGLGVVSMDRIIDTGDGRLRIFGRTMQDVSVHGEIPFRDVITLSSNVGMAKTARLLKQQDLYRYARDYGFGQKTWIDLPGEVAGLLKKTDRWSRTTLTSLAIGYEVDVTPLQIVMAYAALADGGRLRQPYVVAERRDVTGNVLWRAEDEAAYQDSVRRIIDASTARTLLPAFTGVVERGTATRAHIDGLAIAGKTGTARKVVNGRYGRKYRATFVGFYPADKPQVAMIVVMDEPKTSIYGGTVSAPVFRRVAERWIGTLPEIAKEMMPPDPLLTLVPVPDKAPMRFASRTVVRSQPDDHMPNFLGKSAREARYQAALQGMQVYLTGHGRVIHQHPAPGDSAEHEVILTLQ